MPTSGVSREICRQRDLPPHAQLVRFVSILSPRPLVRGARRDAAGGWLNDYDEELPIVRIEPGRPVLMHLSRSERFGPQRFAFDFDAGKVRSSVAAADMETVAALAEFSGAWSVPVRSGPSGGRHLWLACDEELPLPLFRRLIAVGETLSKGGVLPSLDVYPWKNLATSGVRPPGSPHRSGGHAQLLRHDADTAIELLATGSPVSVFEELAGHLEALAQARGLTVEPPRPPKQRRVKAGSSGTGSHLPPSVLGVSEEYPDGRPVLRPVETGEDGHPRLKRPRRCLSEAPRTRLETRLAPEVDHSAFAFGVLLGLALAGCSFTDVLRMARSPKASPGLEWLRSARAQAGRALRLPREEEETEELLERQWRHAVHAAARMPLSADADDDPFPEVTARISDLLERMEACDPERWKRPSGPADYVFLHVYGLVALTSGTLQVDLDNRRAGLMMGYSHQTANESFRRTAADGWLYEHTPANRRERRARTIGLATEHECTGDEHHMCAIYAVRSGSDTSDNAPPSPLRAPLLRHLNRVVTTACSDLWTDLGHHTLRTYLELLKAPQTLGELAEHTGYTVRTVRKHLRQLEGTRLVRPGLHGSWQPMGRSPREAEIDTPSFGRRVLQEESYRINAAVLEWWEAEHQWLCLPLAEKRARGRRRDPNQGILPGTPAELVPGARAFPRRADGKPDFARARAIEAERLAAEARQAAARPARPAAARVMARVS